MDPNDVERMVNSADPDQDQEQPDLGLHCLLMPICSKSKDFYGIY